MGVAAWTSWKDHEALNTVSRVLARHGTTSFLPTTVSSSVEVLTSAVQSIGKLIGETFAGARPLGIHLEGPFINPTKRGTHKSANVRNPDVQLFREWKGRRIGNPPVDARARTSRRRRVD